MRSAITGIFLALGLFLTSTATPLPPHGGPKLDQHLSTVSDLDPILAPNEIFPSPTPTINEHWASNSDPILDPNEIFPSPTIKHHKKRGGSRGRGTLCSGDMFRPLCDLVCRWTEAIGHQPCFPDENEDTIKVTHADSSSTTSHGFHQNCGHKGQPLCPEE